ncbi:uncharacterized protein LACBIDRAFT_295337 [Laccaria bicolor S238N-H82]|uniref:Predicted protein n=1 Tax=Laccaria bicolor (strain S238N-H82 / ATCC MYA-4686) TaxID=486041 RepID=B0DQS1_LACBS|nr:uncharacterized protein LACBIDRAFT_295337 [Laccaria bicolor S238N-H82]EDR03080.1 predicted protein [Laccaria bicolor S238N-H82]|eukprot:XP_001886221.1 predicted protein [Laccaria bicolor S238N-H82]
MPQPITRETFIDLARAEATALTQESMYDEDVEQVPIPESFRKFGVPRGYSVDFALDPALLVAFLAKRGIVNEDQIPHDLLRDLKDTNNATENLKIVPTCVYDDKRARVDAALERAPDNSFGSPRIDKGVGEFGYISKFTAKPALSREVARRDEKEGADTGEKEEGDTQRKAMMLRRRHYYENHSFKNSS